MKTLGSRAKHFKSLTANISFLRRLLLLLLGSVLIMQLQAAPGDVDLTFDGGSTLNGAPYAIALQSDGKILIGGDFTTVAGLMRNRIARLNADGTGDPGFNPGTGVDGLIRSVVLQPDGKVLLGGWFTNVDGITRNRIARLNADGSLDPGFDPGRGADNMVFAVALQSDGKVLMGGYFTNVNGVSRSYLARLNADGSVDAGFNPGANYYVYSIVLQPDGKILVGGLFTAMDGVNISRIARLNPDGSLDPSFHPGSGVSYFGVTALALQPDGSVLIGGIFNTVNGTRHENIARLKADGSVDASFNGAASGEVGSIAVQPDGKLLIGGQFLHYDGTLKHYLARLNANGSLDAAFDPPLSGYPPGVSVIALQSDGQVLVAGSGLYAVGDKIRFALIRLKPDGNADPHFNPGTGIGGFQVAATIVQSDGKVVIGGKFTDVGGVSRASVARLDAQGRLDPSFDPGIITGTSATYTPPVPVIYSMVQQPDGKILIAGGFTNVNGQTRNCIARLNADGSLDAGFDPGTTTTYSVYDLVLQPDGKVLVAAGFVARLNPDGSPDAGFNPALGPGTASVSDLAVQPDGRIIAVGYSSSNRVIQHFVVRLHPDGSWDPSFNPGSGPDNGVSSVALLSSGKVLIGGQFTNFAGINRKYLARLNSDGSVDPSFDAGTGPDFPFITISRSFVEQPDGKVLVWGNFTNFNGAIRRGLARLNVDGSVDATIDPNLGVQGQLWSATVQRDSRIVICGSFWSFNGVPRQAVARLLGDAPVILKQPASRTNVVGTTAAFTVVVSGAEPLTYQWYKDGIALADGRRISGATTATLTLERVRRRDAGEYTVVITNLAGSVVSEAARLQVRRRPIARIQIAPVAEFPGVTNRLIISPNNTNAVVVLDASRSRGAAAANLAYVWMEGTNIFATGITVTNRRALGVHTVSLVVADGFSSGTNAGTFEVIKPSSATRILSTQIEEAQLPGRVKRQLLMRLSLASTMFDRGHYSVGIHSLRVCQFLTRVQVAPLAPALADDLMSGAQEIIKTLAAAAGQPLAGSQARMHRMTRQPDGGIQFQVSARPGVECAVEASTDLLEWQVIGVFQTDGTGLVNFEDPEAARFPARFYRVVSTPP